MPVHALIDPSTGCVQQLSNAQPAPEGSVLWPADLDLWEAGRWRWTAESGWEPRPALVCAQEGNILSWQHAPAGTLWQVSDDDIGEQLATGLAGEGGIVLHLPDAGRYRVVLEPPRPWMPFTQVFHLEGEPE